MRDKLIFASVLDGYARRKDRSVSLRFHTQELTSADIMDIDAMCDSYGYLYFRPGEKANREEMKELDQVEMPDLSSPKSQSKRLRSVLYLLHKKDGGDMTFQDYYVQKTERIINHYKEMLDE